MTETYQAFLWELNGEYRSRYVLIGNVVVNTEHTSKKALLHCHVMDYADAEMARDIALSLTKLDENKGLVLSGSVLMCSIDTDLEALVRSGATRSPLIDEKVRRLVTSIYMGGLELHFAGDAEE